MVDMGCIDSLRLNKILSLVRQENENRSIAAFLMARRLLKKYGMGLIDLMVDDNAPPSGLGIEAYLRLRKIIALASSDKDGEAIAAFLMARRTLHRFAIGFDAVLRLDHIIGADAFTNAYPNAEMEIIALRKRIHQLEADLAARTVQLQRYEDAIGEMVQNALIMHAAQDGAQDGAHA